MTVEETLSYLLNFPAWTPDAFHNGPAVSGLTPVKKLLARLGDPQDAVPCVHIAGTNGKGSTAAFLQEILTQAGLKAGLFTSPFLKHFSEEIRIGHTPIGDDDLAACTTRVRKAAEQLKKEEHISPTKFEIECSIAFLYFAEQNCDISVLEVGLGGRLDATNVVKKPELGIITTISLDHTEILGNTLTEIAAEKAGIIKEGMRILLYPQKDEMRSVIERICKERHAILIDAKVPGQAKAFNLDGQIFDLPDLSGTSGSSDIPGLSDLHISLLGSYQIKNAAVAAQAALLLRETSLSKGSAISESAIRNGLTNTVWHGRFELLKKQPYIFLDGSHNAEGAVLLAESIRRYFPKRKVYFVTGVLADKDYEQMMRLIVPLSKCFFTIAPPSPRALSAGELAACIEKLGGCAAPYDTLESAIHAALLMAGNDDVVVISGSLYYIGTARDIIKA